MSKFFIYFLVGLSFYACGQVGRSNISEDQNAITTTEVTTPKQKHLLYDTSKIAILAFDTAYYFLLKDAMPANLTQADLQTLDSLVMVCIQVHNSKQDTTKEFSEYIDVKNYKRQYLPFQDKEGKRKVYVSGFCTEYGDFNYWKTSLVMVDDGGSCFFQATIDLSAGRCERFSTNGYG